MERKRQIPQDLNRLHGERLQLLQKSIGICAIETVTREIEVPSRVEGRTVRRTVPVPTLVKKAEYASVSEYLYQKAEKYRQNNETTQQNNWTIDDIPADVNAACDEYMAVERANFADWQQVVAAHAEASIDRMLDTSKCKNCVGREQYLCHSCGSARQLYTYPLVRMRDPTTNEIHDVPFDAALYIREHPQDNVLSINKTISSAGTLSAIYELKFQPDVFSAQYVTKATNGTITPTDVGLEFADGMQFSETIELARWNEGAMKQNRYNEHITTSDELLDAAQTRIMQRYSERADGVDYNSLLQKVQHQLGEHGLSLFYHWRAGGMGDWDVIYSAHSTEGEKNYLAVKETWSVDAYEGLVKFADQLQTAVIRHEQ